MIRAWRGLVWALDPDELVSIAQSKLTRVVDGCRMRAVHQ